MSIIHCFLDEFNAFLVKKFENFKLANKDENSTQIKIFNCYLPTKRKTTNSDYPFVIIRPTNGEVDNDNNVMVRLIIGCFGEDTETMKDVFSIINKIEISILEDYNTFKKFKIEKPIKWETYDEQPYPQWLAEMSFNVNFVNISLKEKAGDIFGSYLE